MTQKRFKKMLRSLTMSDKQINRLIAHVKNHNGQISYYDFYYDFSCELYRLVTQAALKTLKLNTNEFNLPKTESDQDAIHELHKKLYSALGIPKDTLEQCQTPTDLSIDYNQH
jgi:hypothetical protein